MKYIAQMLNVRQLFLILQLELLIGMLPCIAKQQGLTSTHARANAVISAFRSVSVKPLKYFYRAAIKGPH